MKRRIFQRRRIRGALAVEAAFALPVIIAGAMMFTELGNIGLTIASGGTALERAIHQLRTGAPEPLQAAQIERRVRQGMAGSHRFLGDADIATVAVESYASLDAIGTGHPEATRKVANPAVPVWRITVEIRKDFITPLPRLLGIGGTAFRYQYQQLLGDLGTQTAYMKQD